MNLTESIVEEAALEWFGELGYSCLGAEALTPALSHGERESYGEVVLVGRLRAALRRINPTIPEEAREEALRKVVRLDFPSLVAANRGFHKFLRDGVDVEYARPDGSTRHDKVWLVDFADVQANDWLAVNQFTVIEQGHNRRPDVVVFLNGLPLGLIELKNAADEDATIWSAYQQLQTYKAEIPTLLRYNAALIVSDGVQARIGSLTANQEWFKVWRTIAGDVDAPAGTLELETLVRGVFDRERLLRLLENFIVFEEDPDNGALHKIIAGYHQFHAVTAAVEETVRASGMCEVGLLRETPGTSWAGKMHGGKPGDRRAGVVWHTQGSGKSFTMLFFAAAVVRHPAMQNPTLVVLTDRNDLDDQLFGQFQRCHDILGQMPIQATDRAHLRELLNRASGGVVFTTLQKFAPLEPSPRPSPSGRGSEQYRGGFDFSGLKKEVRELRLKQTEAESLLWELLRNQLALAYEGEAEQLQSKLRSEKNIDEIFRRAQAAFNAWSALPAEDRTATAILNSLDFDFFEVLDSVTIARSRRHITTYYDTSDIGTFPERLKPLSFHCPLTHRADVIGFNEIFARLSTLALALYAPLSYVQPSRLSQYEDLYDPEADIGHGNLKQSGREKGIQALMTVNLLKRLESSVHAFRLTLKSLADNHHHTLAKIAAFKKTGRDATFADVSPAFADVEPDDEADYPDPDDTQIGNKVQISLSDMDLPRWEQELRGDLAIIEDLLAEMRKVTPSDDAKLQHLKTTILSKLASPINPGNRKVLLFTAFADTADYLYDHLAPFFLEQEDLHTGKVTGSDSPKSTFKKNYDFQSLLTLFSPRSKEKAAILPKELGEIDLLIGTDCISEGQNLQDCDYLINYDIHWNPVRIIQRFGRIDRIGSQNRCIQLVNYWPDITLDEYINLKERVENRMIIADVTATGDDNPLDSKANDVSYRREQLRRLQEEVIEMEDLKTGISITDLGLNDFRMDLVNYVKAHGDLASLPNGMHAVVPAALERGLVPGVIFALRNRNDGVNINRQNRLHPYYIVYVAQDGNVVVNHTDAKRLLDLARAACKDRSAPIPEAYQPFNRATHDGRRMDAYSALLQKGIQSMIAIKEEKDIDSLFSGGTTTALSNTINGLGDFELIAFLVVHPQE